MLEILIPSIIGGVVSVVVACRTYEKVTKYRLEAEEKKALALANAEHDHKLETYRANNEFKLEKAKIENGYSGPMESEDNDIMQLLPSLFSLLMNKGGGGGQELAAMASGLDLSQISEAMNSPQVKQILDGLTAGGEKKTI